jgi:SAM-dependent methyltransferase
MLFHSAPTMYSEIATEFSNTRTRPWPCVETFLTNRSRGSLLDAGCGNGRNMLYAQELGFRAIGFDVCDEFVDICKRRGLSVYHQSIETRVEGSYDAILCIAVLHHLRSDKARQDALCNLYSALAPGGAMLFTVWSFEIEDGTGVARYPRSFVIGDNNVPWKLYGKSVDRYYFIYDRATLDEFLARFRHRYPEARVQIEWEEQNWNVTIWKP